MSKEQKYQTVVCEVNNNFTVDSFCEEKINTTDNANFFFLFSNIYNNDNNISISVFDICDEISTKLNISLHNIIVVPRKVNQYLDDNVMYVLWFVKDKKNIFFDKDPIREKHIWKDAEWGKREKNYHPKGKDPGNVWITTEDDGKGKIVKHNLLSEAQVIERCLITTLRENDRAFLLSSSTTVLSLSKDITIKKIPFGSLSLQKNDDIDYKSNRKTIDSTHQTSKVIFSTSENMIHVQNEEVNLVVTSPPYWDLKNYFKKGQIGQESYSDYLLRMNKVWHETYRILKNNGNLFVNINTRSKNKEFLLIPQDIIKQCLAIGYKLHRILIWHKSSGIPTSNQNLVDRFEYFLWFSKGNVSNINIISLANEYKNNDLHGGIIWNINRKAGSIAKDLIHPAIYPTELIERIVKLVTIENDTVLDPFLGSGTSIVAALKNNRQGIGYEFNEGFLDLIKYVISSNNLGDYPINFILDEKVETNGVFREKIKSI